MPNFNLESELIDKGYRHIIGTDEASRGALVGKVFAGAVILDQDLVSVFEQHVNDSKKLSEKKRNELYDIITNTCEWSVGEATHLEIEEYNILNATRLAIKRAVEALPNVDFVLVDGNMVFDDLLEVPYKSIVKGDSTCLSIAASSIIAKTHQCRYMYELDKQYPQYAFARNKGYGTKAHIKAIEKYGPCPLHRKTFKRVREFV